MAIITNTPGVYVEEISTLPPSVAQGATAIPAFIGCTKVGPLLEPTVIGSMLEFQEIFGGAKPTGFTVDLNVSPPLLTSDATDGQPDFLLYYALSHYFKNGGGRCYVVSIGGYTNPLGKDACLKGLAAIEKEDEPTLLVLTDAVKLESDDYYEVCAKAIEQCEKLGDRFAILDVHDGNVELFRDGVGTSSLKYAAAYHPYLETSMNHQYDESGVVIVSGAKAASTWSAADEEKAVTVSFDGVGGPAPTMQLTKGNADDQLEFVVIGRDLAIKNFGDSSGSTIAEAFGLWAQDNDDGGFSVEPNGTEGGVPQSTRNSKVKLDQSSAASTTTLSDLKDGENASTAVYNKVKMSLAGERVTLPPSAAMAGIYARVDRQRGVWKAPANESIAAVIRPIVKISHEDQDQLNVDVNAGKSINAIRQFAGKGTLVWGARTLAGNDNEWRYVPVRRLFSVIEESTKKASSFAVFEPNDATTWLKVKGMIEAYLFGLWEQGALAGPTPEAAYFVHIGLGRTMTSQDVLEGRMIVQIGIAAVRPAEFIIIKFSHKLQEA